MTSVFATERNTHHQKELLLELLRQSAEQKLQYIFKYWQEKDMSHQLLAFGFFCNLFVILTRI
jgi:hypothetical protein